VTGSRLERLVRDAPRRAAPVERSDLCAAVVPPEHRHLMDLDRHAVLCACRACTVLFDHSAAGGRHYRLVPAGWERLDDFELDDATWEALGVPVNLAFFVRDGGHGRVVASCPSPMGITHAAVDVTAWRRVEADNPGLAELEPDVEALLVHRARGAREHWRAPIDVCFRLAAIVRQHWKGLGGGSVVWAEIDRFFTTLEKGDPAWPR
jgi:hypothetical protein